MCKIRLSGTFSDLTLTHRYISRHIKLTVPYLSYSITKDHAGEKSASKQQDFISKPGLARLQWLKQSD